MFFSALRRAVSEHNAAEADRDYWKVCADRLQKKLEERSDFFIEREMRLVDRFLTARVKTHAITDEIRGKPLFAQIEEQQQANLEAYLEEKRQWLIEMATQANEPDPVATANADFEANKDYFILDFQQDHSVM